MRALFVTQTSYPFIPHFGGGGAICVLQSILFKMRHKNENPNLHEMT